MKTLCHSIVLLFCLSLAGCAVPPPQSLTETPLTRVAAIGPAGLFAASPDGRRAAVVDGALRLHDLASGAARLLSPDAPAALAWDSRGATLAAAFPAGAYATLLRHYSAGGEPLQELRLPIAPSQLAWSLRGDLLVTGIAVQKYSFGANLRQLLYRVAGDEPTEVILSDTTLKPGTAKQFERILLKLQPVAFAAAGDELVYAALHDPPEFPPYLELLYRNWQSGRHRSLQKLPLQELQLAWDSADQAIAVVTAGGEQRLALWPPADDERPAGEGYRLVDGRLYDGPQLLVDWGRGARWQRLADGRFLLAQGGRLYLGDGLRATGRQAYSEKGWTMRRWRFEELISPADYQRFLQEERP